MIEWFFQSVLGVRRQERTLAVWMALYHFLLLVSLYLLKPVRDSLFLSERGPAELPFVFILTTAVVVPVAYLHTRAGRELNVGPLIDGVSGILVLSLVGLWGLIGGEGEWTAYLLYAWVSIYGLLITSQFWLMANALFTASQSKRVFTILSAGAILGSIVGGEVTGLLVEGLGVESESLLLGAGGVLFASTGLGRWIRGHRHQGEGGLDGAPDAPAPEEAAGAISIIRDSRHVQLIVGTLTLMVVVSTLVDYQFKAVATRAFPTEDGLTSFMGQFYGRVSLLALLVQFVLAPWLMRVAGIGGALSVLPGVLALGSVGMLVMPGLAAGVFLRGAGQSLKHSLDKTGRELLFVPVPMAKKKRVKVFIDLFVDQGAQGLAGVLLVGLAFWAGMSVKMLGVVVLGLIGVWGLLAYRVRHSYVDQFRTKLRARQQDAEPTSPDEADADLEELLASLCSHAETEALQALDELKESDVSVPVEALLCLLDHPAAAVRAEVLRVLRVRRVEEAGDRVAEALRDPDPDVQLEAARYLYCEQTDHHRERLHEGLHHDDPQIQAATVGLIAEEGQAEEFQLVPDELLQRLATMDGVRGSEARVHVARILGTLDRPYRNDLLHDLLDDANPQVVRAAIKAAGDTGARTFVHKLVQLLAEEECAHVATQALGAFGRPLHGTLYDYMVDEHIPLAARRQIPAVFAAQPSPFVLTLLVRSLDTVPVPVRHAVVRALSKIHKEGDYACDAEVLESAIEWEVEHYVVLGQILNVGRRADLFGRSQLDVLREEALERIFRLLGLRYNQRDLYDAYLGLTSPDSDVHDSAVEFVDNLVDYSVRQYLVPALEAPDGAQTAEVGARFFDRQIQTPTAARRYARSVDDPRLAESVLGTDDQRSSASDNETSASTPVSAPGE